MKKTMSLCIVMSLISLSGVSQTKNVDVDNVGVTYSYRSLPTEPQNPMRFEYATKVISLGLAKNYVSISTIADAIFIEGQERTGDPEDALLNVELYLGNVVITSSDVKERKDEDKDKNGNVTKTTYYYKMVVRYTYETEYVVYKKGQLLKRGSALESFEYRFESEEYKTHKAAADFWTNNKDAHVSNFYIERAGDALAYLNSKLSSLYGFQTTTKYDIIKHIDTKKHDENTPFRTAAAALKAEIEAMTPDKPMNKTAVEPLIEYFKGILTKYTDDKSKADVRIRYAALWNLCKIYIYLDEPEKVAQYANLIAPNGYDPKDGAKLNKEAGELKANFDRTGIKTLHFNPEEYF